MGCASGLRFRMDYKNYGHCRDARELYADLGTARQAPACTECRRCEQACPNRLSIVEKLKEAHALLAYLPVPSPSGRGLG